MPPEPKFAEMQAVQLVNPAVGTHWTEGIVIERCWEESENYSRVGNPHGPRWVYEVQIGDPNDLFETWYTEDDLRAR